MLKCLLKRIVHAPIAKLILIGMGLHAMFSLIPPHGVYNYDCVDKEAVDRIIQKEVNPNLVIDEEKPQCKYKVLDAKHTLYGEKNPIYVQGNVDNVLNGTYIPKECTPVLSVAILVTYRDRAKQLEVFLSYIHQFIQKQQIHYKVFVIEQNDTRPWNKGVLYNIGAMVAIRERFPCLILHDVDLLPMDDGNPYACLSQPRHISASIDKFRYVLPYWYLTGGVTSISSEQYRQINGFSNLYTDWGGEDDDFTNRILNKDLTILRLPNSMSHYHMMLHQKATVNTKRLKLLKEMKGRGNEDGLSTVKYRSLKVNSRPLYQHLLVET